MDISKRGSRKSFLIRTLLQNSESESEHVLGIQKSIVSDFKFIRLKLFNKVTAIKYE